MTEGIAMKICTHEELTEYSRDGSLGMLHQTAHALRRRVDELETEREELIEMCFHLLDHCDEDDSISLGEEVDVILAKRQITS